MKKKIVKIICIILASILIAVLTAISVFSIADRVKYSEFYKNSEKLCTIPGLWDGVVQQGFDYSEEHGIYIYSGYMKDNSASRLYVFDSDGNSRYVELREKDGSDCKEHVGGVSFGGDYIYVTASSRNQIMMFKASDVLDGDGVATVFDTFDILLSPAYVYVRGSTLYTGEFYIAKDYETPESHRLTTPESDKNTSIMGVYTLGGNGKPVSAEPDYIMSTREKVQGMAFDSQGRLILSTSYGLSKSQLFVYDLDKVINGRAEIDGKKFNVKYVDSKALDATITAPPMAEELVYKDGKLLIMTESASMKYIFGKFTSGADLRAYDYDTAVGKTGSGDKTLTPAH